MTLDGPPQQLPSEATGMQATLGQACGLPSVLQCRQCQTARQQQEQLRHL
jgi:hypothetical protein